MSGNFKKNIKQGFGRGLETSAHFLEQKAIKLESSM